MRKFLLGVLIFLVVFNGVVFASSESSGGSYTIDNDGTERRKEDCYGDSKLPSSYDVDYYDCYIPYKLTPKDIGGWAYHVDGYTDDTYNYHMENKYPQRIETEGIFAYVVNGYTSKGPTFMGGTVSVEEETGLQVLTDKNGNKFYLSAIQYFFYNSGKEGVIQWNNQNGQLFDIILTDGTVIHFVVVDANAIAHTNGGPVEETLWNVMYRYRDIKLPQYKNLYHAAYGNMLEMSGKSWGAGVNEFMKKYNLASDGNKIAYYRMFNCKVNENKQRNNGVGKEVSYNLGNVTISSSGSNSGGVLDNGVLVDEKDLVGMPNLDLLSDDQNVVTLPDGGELTANEADVLSNLKEGFEIENKEGKLGVIRTVISFLGLCLLLYDVLLLLAYAFDRVNILFNGSLLGLLTFGAVQYGSDEGKEKSRVTKKLLKVLVLNLVVGMMLVTGSIYGIVERVILWIRDY